ncbi:MAG: F0F1 ATP synthase subunit gamma [Bacteroides sp.]
MIALKEVKNRINSVKNTRKITSAMKMVASAKLHKMQGLIQRMWPYQQELNRIVANLLGSEVSISSPYVLKREKVTRVAIVVFSSNSSLCGGFNTNVIKEFSRKMTEYEELGSENILIFPIGRKIEEAVRRMGLQSQGSFDRLSDKPTYDEAMLLANKLMNLFETEKVDRVDLVYHHFKSRGTQILKDEVYLPININHLIRDVDQPEDCCSITDYIIEPSVEELIEKLFPTLLRQKIFTTAVDSSTSEHAARTLAMQIATDNANDLIQELTKQYNKSRQQAITNELLDIVGGSLQ